METQQYEFQQTEIRPLWKSSRKGIFGTTKAQPGLEAGKEQAMEMLHIAVTAKPGCNKPIRMKSAGSNPKFIVLSKSWRNYACLGVTSR